MGIAVAIGGCSSEGSDAGTPAIDQSRQVAPTYDLQDGQSCTGSGSCVVAPEGTATAVSPYCSPHDACNNCCQADGATGQWHQTFDDPCTWYCDASTKWDEGCRTASTLVDPDCDGSLSGQCCSVNGKRGKYQRVPWNYCTFTCKCNTAPVVIDCTGSILGFCCEVDGVSGTYTRAPWNYCAFVCQ